MLVDRGRWEEGECWWMMCALEGLHSRWPKNRGSLNRDVRVD